MASKLFLTGVTGYVGGSVFATLVERHPEYAITVLLRKSPADFSTKYPNVQVVKGDYDSAEIISDAASKADVVVHSGDSDHVPSLKAIFAGLRKQNKRTFFIHLSGTGILSDYKDTEKYRGRLNPHVYSDVTGIDEVISRPDGSLHRHTDKLIQEIAKTDGDKINVAIVCPPNLYGRGLGPGKTHSAYVPMFVREIKKIGAPFYCNDGSNTRGWLNINDLMDVYVPLVEAAVAGGGNVTWGTKGYFFATSQEASQIDIATATGKILHAKGVITSATPKQISEEAIEATSGDRPGLGLYMFASNSRAKAERAAKELGYEPKHPTLWEVLESDLTDALEL